jgi:hypothetical protein
LIHSPAFEWSFLGALYPCVVKMTIFIRQQPIPLGLMLMSMTVGMMANPAIASDVQYAETFIETLPVKPRRNCQKFNPPALLSQSGVTEQVFSATPEQPCPPNPETPQAIQNITTGLLNNLATLPTEQFPVPGAKTAGLSPGTTISNPSGFGADGNRIFVTADYQARTRNTRSDDGEAGIGVALGDAKQVGVELSYTQASFGRYGKSGGGFSTKIHHRFSDSASAAIGWNYFAKLESPGYLDYPKNSYYAAYSQILKTREFIDQPFSRVAVSAGVGGGQFLTETKAGGGNPQGVNVFGSVALRVAQPVSVITEWTGQDLAMGLSIVPFKNIPIVITPALRDITGAGNGARFVLGTGFSFKF